MDIFNATFGNFGSSPPRLHAKVALIDQRLVLVGSVNLDSRSATCTGWVCWSMAALCNGPGPTARAAALTTTEEPESSLGLRLKLWLQGLVVEERQL